MSGLVLNDHREGFQCHQPLHCMLSVSGHAGRPPTGKPMGRSIDLSAGRAGSQAWHSKISVKCCACCVAVRIRGFKLKFDSYSGCTDEAFHVTVHLSSFTILIVQCSTFIVHRKA